MGIDNNIGGPFDGVYPEPGRRAQDMPFGKTQDMFFQYPPMMAGEAGQPIAPEFVEHPRDYLADQGQP